MLIILIGKLPMFNIIPKKDNIKAKVLAQRLPFNKPYAITRLKTPNIRNIPPKADPKPINISLYGISTPKNEVKNNIRMPVKEYNIPPKNSRIAIIVIPTGLRI